MIYYNKNKILSYDFDFMFICGGKDIGKSYTIKEFLIHKFLKKKSQFLFLTRYENEQEGELNKVKTYFNDKKLSRKYYDYSIIYKNKRYYLFNKNTEKKQLFGYVGALNKLSQQTGSISVEDIDYVIFEEFQNIDGRYLKDEVNKFLILYNSIARGDNKPTRRVKVFFLSNAFSITNPYFSEFQIDKRLRIGTKILKYKDKNIIVEMAEAQDVVNTIKKSNFYKLIKNTKYEEFSLANKFYLDNDAVIKKLKSNDKIFIKFKYDKKIFSLYKSSDYLIFTEKQNKEKTEIITITEDDFTPNKMKIELFKKTASYKIIYKFFISSKIFFTSQYSYKAFLFIISI